MKITNTVKQILNNYTSESPAIRSNLAKILMHGKLAGTGKMVILPVDQGFEHGPDRSFAVNSLAYDPTYHFKLAIDSGLNAYAAPLGFLSAGIEDFIGQIPMILKLNSNNSLVSSASLPDQAYTSSVKDAVRLGCAAVGLTIYPGSGRSHDMIEEAKEVLLEARSYGLPTVIWSYPRGGELSKDGETAIDICSYGAHIAALIGAHIIKVKPPTFHIEHPEAKKVIIAANLPINTLAERIRHVVNSCFNGKRLVIFSGGAAKSEESLIEEVKAIRDGGGNGSIIGRNCFQRPLADAISLLENICKNYK